MSRVTGHISSFSLPDFDSYYSVASWYRDYVAYCGVDEEGDKINVMIVQLGRRKPILKKAPGETASGEMPDSICSTAGLGSRTDSCHFRDHLKQSQSSSRHYHEQ